MAIWNLGYFAMVAASLERQPYVELYGGKDDHGKSAKNAELTILLDYPSMSIFYSWYIAFGNRHFLLGLAIILQVLSSVIIVPLASNLFRARASQKTSTLEVNYPRALGTFRLTDPYRDSFLGPVLQPAIEISGAVNTYQASPVAWTTSQYAIEQFLAAHPIQSEVVDADTLVYFAKPNCRIIPTIDIMFSSQESNSVTPIGFMDRDVKSEKRHSPSIS